MKPSEILKAIAELSERDMNIFLASLDTGMWDEWDTGLDTAFQFFGTKEIQVAARSGIGQAEHFEKQGK